MDLITLALAKKEIQKALSPKQVEYVPDYIGDIPWEFSTFGLIFYDKTLDPKTVAKLSAHITCYGPSLNEDINTNISLDFPFKDDHTLNLSLGGANVSIEFFVRDQNHMDTTLPNGIKDTEIYFSIAQDLFLLVSDVKVIIEETPSVAVTVKAETDKTLSKTGLAADAKVVGDKINSIYNAITWKKEEGDEDYEYFGDLCNGSYQMGFKKIFSKPKFLNIFVDGYDRNGISISNTFIEEVPWKNPNGTLSESVGLSCGLSVQYDIYATDKPCTILTFYGQPGWTENGREYIMDYFVEVAGSMSVSADDIMKNSSGKDGALKNLKDGDMDGSISTVTGDEDSTSGANIDKAAYSANIGRYLINYGGYSLNAGYDNENYGRDNAIFGYGNIVGVAPVFENLSDAGKVQYEKTGWTRNMSLYGLNANGTGAYAEQGDKSVFNPYIGSRNLIGGVLNNIQGSELIVTGKSLEISQNSKQSILSGNSSFYTEVVSSIITTTKSSIICAENSLILGNEMKIYSSANRAIVTGYNSEIDKTVKSILLADNSAIGETKDALVIGDRFSTSYIARSFIISTNLSNTVEDSLIIGDVSVQRSADNLDKKIVRSIFIGANNSATAKDATDISYCFAFGYNNTIKGGSNYVFGRNNNFYSNYSYDMLVGEEIQARGNYSLLFGKGLQQMAGGTFQHILGTYNTQNTKALFILANGTSSARKNIFEILNDGTVTTCKSTVESDAGKTLVTKDYVDAMAGGGGTKLYRYTFIVPSVDEEYSIHSSIAIWFYSVLKAEPEEFFEIDSIYGYCSIPSYKLYFVVGNIVSEDDMGYVSSTYLSSDGNYLPINVDELRRIGTELKWSEATLRREEL